jgi:hypothetical protein
MAREAIVNAGIEAAEQPFVNRERRAQGRPEMTPGERAAGVAFAAVGGAALPAGMAGAGKVIGAGTDIARSAFERTVSANWDRLPSGLRERWSSGVSLDDADLADLAELRVGRGAMSEGEAAAIDVLRREGEMARANPFAPNGAGTQLHDAALRGTLATILDDIPVAPRPERRAFVAPEPGAPLPALHAAIPRSAAGWWQAMPRRGLWARCAGPRAAAAMWRRLPGHRPMAGISSRAEPGCIITFSDMAVMD